MKNKLAVILIKIAVLGANIMFALLKLLPVKNKITFISRQADNKTEDMELLESALCEKEPNVELVFLCKKIGTGIGGKISYCFHMLSQMYHIATSKIVVLDSYCICVSVLKQRGSLVVIQMWHALGSLKKFGLSIVGNGEGSDKSIADAFAMHKNYTYVLTSGEACKKHFAEAFGYEEESMVVMSLPRVDKLTDEILKKEVCERIYDEYPDFKNKKVVVYAPTFRRDRDISAEIFVLAECFDRNEYAFVLKKHPLMNVENVGCIVDDKFTTIEMMYAADYVICDYSAVVYEAAVMRKPLFFYTFDYESYGVDRDFYIDYMSEMPGVISGDAERIADAVIHRDYDLNEVEEFSRKYVEQKKGCTKCFVDFIVSKVFF